MKNITLENGTLEDHFGRCVDKIPAILARWKEEGYIPSEADIRLLGVKNFRDHPEIAENYWDSSTLLAVKGDTLKVILPYEIVSRKLTEAARFGLSLMNPNESILSYGVNLDIDSRWEKLEGNGVYTRQRDEWFEKEKSGLLIGLNSEMTEKQAMRCPMLLTKLGHPDFVNAEFARSKEEVAEIIRKTFELGKQNHGHNVMMRQHIPDFSEVGYGGILNKFCVTGLNNRSESVISSKLGNYLARLPFYAVFN